MNARIYATEGDLHHDRPLSDLAVEAFNAQDDEFIGDQVLPMVPVGKESDEFFIIPKAAWLRNEDSLRARGTQARRIEWDVSSDSYKAKNHALADETPLEDMTNADQILNLRETSADLVTSRLKRGQEVRIAGLVTSISNVGSGVQLTGSAKWNNFTGSSPLSDVTSGHAFIRDATGLVANTGVMDWNTFQIVRRHPELLDLYKFTNAGQLTGAQLASTFEVERLLVGKAVIENVLEGSAATSMTNVWGNNLLLAHIRPPQGRKTKTLGLRFQWQPEMFPVAFNAARRTVSGAGTEYIEIVEVQHFQDEKVVAKELGYVIQNTL